MAMREEPINETAAAAYLRKHTRDPPRIQQRPHARLGLAVAIPCRDEPDLLTTLADLWACRRPDCAVEVIVVINAAEDAPPAVHAQNRRTLRQAADWLADKADPRLRFHLLHFPALPARKAGVGLARKLAMDEAVARFLAAGQPDGVIACLDADCRVSPDYLRAIEKHFRGLPETPACSIHYEHDWAALADPRHREGIIQYELHLRTVVAGLRHAGYPFAFHTTGSAMAVRAGAYVRQGGMNQRRGAEDFHFLAKLMPLGAFSALTATTVVPSARASHRVPFGTGRAMADWLADDRGAWLTYAPESYRDLRALMARVEALYALSPDAVPDLLHRLAAPLARFLGEAGFAGRLRELQENSASAVTFRGRFWRWFDRFRVLKYLHFARDRHYPLVPVSSAARTLLAWQGLRAPAPGSESGYTESFELLERYRRLDLEQGTLPATGP